MTFESAWFCVGTQRLDAEFCFCFSGAKEQLKDGLNRLVQSGDESGVWNVIACASSSWVSNVNQIETLTTQLNEYREKERLLSGGEFFYFYYSSYYDKENNNGFVQASSSPRRAAFPHPHLPSLPWT